MTLLTMAREIAKVNEQSLQDDERRVAERYATISPPASGHHRLGLCLSLVLAGLTVVHTLRLERVTDSNISKACVCKRN